MGTAATANSLGHPDHKGIKLGSENALLAFQVHPSQLVSFNNAPYPHLVLFVLDYVTSFEPSVVFFCAKGTKIGFRMF